MNANQTDLEMAVLTSIIWRPQLTPTAFHRIPMDLWMSDFAFQSVALKEVAECVVNTIRCGAMTGEVVNLNSGVYFPA